MQLNYKQGIEIAQEQAITNIFNQNKYENNIKPRIDYDIAVLGIGAAKHSFNNTDGIKLDYHTLKPEETKKTKKKFNDEQIEVILKYKNKGMKNTNIISILQLKHDIKISTSTLKKIFTDSY